MCEKEEGLLNFSTSKAFWYASSTVCGVGLWVEYPIWLEHKYSGIYNFYPLTHQGSHAFHKNQRKGKRNLPLVDRFVKPSKSAP